MDWAVAHTRALAVGTRRPLSMPHILYFVSPHGYGHAARAAAVIAEVRRLLPESRFTAVTTVPRWFFDDSLDHAIGVEAIDVDLGLIQHDAFTEDLPATLTALEARIPFPDKTLDALAGRVDALEGDLVVCDIAPIGLAVARRCGLPSVLVENFTWEWIYRGYQEACPALGAIADELDATFRGADYHVQTEPVCVPSPRAHQVAPVSRPPRTSRSATRRALGIPDEAPMVLVTMGGVGWDAKALHLPHGEDNPWIVIPGSPELVHHDRVIRLPARSAFYHPDLIHAADVVVGKLGYSTLAEVWAAGAPFGYVPRPHFPESAPLDAWLQRELPCRRLAVDQLTSGAWLDGVRALLTEGPCPPTRPGGGGGGARARRHPRDDQHADATALVIDGIGRTSRRCARPGHAP